MSEKKKENKSNKKFVNVDDRHRIDPGLLVSVTMECSGTDELPILEKRGVPMPNVSGKNRVDISGLCRACAKPMLPGTGIKLIPPPAQIVSYLDQFFNIQIVEGDGMPTQLCAACLSNITHWASVCRSIEEAQEYLNVHNSAHDPLAGHLASTCIPENTHENEIVNTTEENDSTSTTKPELLTIECDSHIYEISEDDDDDDDGEDNNDNLENECKKTLPKQEDQSDMDEEDDSQQFINSEQDDNIKSEFLNADSTDGDFVPSDNMSGLTNADNDQQEEDLSVAEAAALEELRKRKWRNIQRQNSLLRAQGKAYLGFRKCGDQTILVPRKARTIGPRCGLFCQRSVFRYCNEMTDTEREEVHRKFWNSTWAEKKIYVRSHVMETDTIRKSPNPKTKKRDKALRYYLDICGEPRRVCQNFFLSTLAMKHSQLNHWLKSKEELLELHAKEEQRRKRRERIDSSQTKIQVSKDFVIRTLDNLPKKPSDADPKCKDGFSSIRAVHRYCTIKAKNFGVHPISWPCFIDIFHEKNMSASELLKEPDCLHYDLSIQPNHLVVPKNNSQSFIHPPDPYAHHLSFLSNSHVFTPQDSVHAMDNSMNADDDEAYGSNVDQTDNQTYPPPVDQTYQNTDTNCHYSDSGHHHMYQPESAGSQQSYQHDEGRPMVSTNHPILPTDRHEFSKDS